LRNLELTAKLAGWGGHELGAGHGASDWHLENKFARSDATEGSTLLTEGSKRLGYVVSKVY